MIYVSFRAGFRAGFTVAIVLAVYLIWLWRPERQVRLHNDHLLDAVETKSWSRFGDFIDESYRDQWGNERVLLLARLREILRYAPNLRIEQLGVGIEFVDHDAQCRALIRIDADDNDLTAIIKQRVNPLGTPFVFHWRHASAKPWDWKLTRVSNDELQLPESGFE